MIGARVIKTCIAVGVSILIARSLGLYASHFAGIIAVLSVQPSLYRSLRNGLQQTISAVIGAVLGAAALFAIGGSFLAMAFTALVVMAFHVKMKWTQSLLVSVVSAINTMGSAGLGFWEAAWNQIALVLIGTGCGALVNFMHKPVHQERAEVILKQSEEMLRALLHYLLLHLQQRQILSFSAMKEQIDQVKGYIRKGSEIAGLIHEDRQFRVVSGKNMATIFHTFENMLERIRDMSKALTEITGIDSRDREIDFMEKAIELAVKMQEKIVQGKRMNPNRLVRVLEQKRKRLWTGEPAADFVNRLGYYNVYGYLIEYLREMERFRLENLGPARKRLTYVSVDRPFLLAEIASILGENGLNITGVSIQAGGQFATTTIEVSCPRQFEWSRIIARISEVESVLSVHVE